jgi:hypothetical protein
MGAKPRAGFASPGTAGLEASCPARIFIVDSILTGRFAGLIFKLAVELKLLHEIPRLKPVRSTEFRIARRPAVRAIPVQSEKSLVYQHLVWKPRCTPAWRNSKHDFTDHSMSLTPVILSGGAGTRLWPVSRRAHPKPFMKLLDGESLAEKTFRRALAVAGTSPVLTVTSRDYYFYTRDLYNRMVGEEHEHPFRWSRRPEYCAAIALAAMYLNHRSGPDATMLVPADHLVPEVKFRGAVDEAVSLAIADTWSLSAFTRLTRKRVMAISAKAAGWRTLQASK